MKIIPYFLFQSSVSSFYNCMHSCRGYFLSDSHHASVGHPQSMSPPGAEANMRFQASFSEAQHNMDNYDEAEMKAFYNKADTMSSGPYATTMILNNMPDRVSIAMLHLNAAYLEVRSHSTVCHFSVY